MLKIRQFDLSYESMENTRSKFHKVNCYISSRLTEYSQPAVDILEGKETHCSCFIECCK